MLLIIWWFLTIISWKIDSFLPKCLCCFQDDQFILQSSLVLCHCPGHCLMYLRKEIKQEIVLFFPNRQQLWYVCSQAFELLSSRVFRNQFWVEVTSHSACVESLCLLEMPYTNTFHSLGEFSLFEENVFLVSHTTSKWRNSGILYWFEHISKKGSH